MSDRINFAEAIEFFRHTMEAADKDEEKLDERLQPIPPELHGAITRTSPELLRHYENLGEMTPIPVIPSLSVTRCFLALNSFGRNQ
jgi:hypothetical protein